MPPRLPFDRVATIYDETRGHPPKILARILSILVDQLHGKMVLEVGVGTGRYAVPLQKSGISVVGVDISRRMVELGLAKGLRNVVFADGARLPFASKVFDVATTSHMLHLVPDWRDVLLETARVTRETYFSIVERWDGPGLAKAYHRIVREDGYDWEAPGLHERDLPGVVPPEILMPVGPFSEHVPAESVLAELDRRDYSSQWEVPEPLHRKAMDVLRKEWAGKELVRTVTIEVTFWRVARIAEVVRTAQRS